MNSGSKSQRDFNGIGPFIMSNVSAAVAAPPLESFAALFEESLNRKEMRVGEVITAEVVRVDQNWVVVNAGLKSESFIPVDEFRNDRGDLDVKPGDFTSVAIEALSSSCIWLRPNWQLWEYRMR